MEWWEAMPPCPCHTVNVNSTAGIVAREGGLEMNDTVGVTLLNTSVEGRVDVPLIRRVAVPAGDNP
jgi:hypothetical protein